MDANECAKMMQARQQSADNMAAINQASAYQDQEAGISGMIRRAARDENEACAVLAESLGFPELARYIRMRVSTPAKDGDPDPT